MYKFALLVRIVFLKFLIIQLLYPKLILVLLFRFLYLIILHFGSSAITLEKKQVLSFE